MQPAPGVRRSPAFWQSWRHAEGVAAGSEQAGFALGVSKRQEHVALRNLVSGVKRQQVQSLCVVLCGLFIGQ